MLLEFRKVDNSSITAKIGTETFHIGLLASLYPEIKADLSYEDNATKASKHMGTIHYHPTKGLSGATEDFISFAGKARLSLEQERFLQSSADCQCKPVDQHWAAELILFHTNAALFDRGYKTSWDALPDYTGPTVFDPFDL